MKRSLRIALIIVAALLAGMTLVTVLGKRNHLPLEVRAVGSSLDGDGKPCVSFMVTNASQNVFPSFAVVRAPEGEVPLVVVETESEGGWTRAADPTGYRFSHQLNPRSSWQFQVPVDEPLDRPHRVVMFYTLGQRDLPPILNGVRDLWRAVGGARQIRELRSGPFALNETDPSNGSRPIRSETNQTSSTADSRR